MRSPVDSRAVIFSPGPANISERVRRALTLPDICHRDEEFRDLLAEIRTLLPYACNTQDGYRSVILGGSGTLAIESLLTTVKGVSRGVLVVANGVYGERAAAICATYGIPCKELRLQWGEPIDMARLEKALEDPQVDTLYLVHHETTTGLLNPLEVLGPMAKTRGKWVLVDAVSSIAGERCEPQAWGVDAFVGTATKCIRGVPGLAFVVVRDEFLAWVRGRQRSSFYSDLLTHLNAEESTSELPFTPPVQVCYACRAALRELKEEGLEGRIQSIAAVSQALRKGLTAAGVRLYLREELYANSMTSAHLPEGWTFPTLHAALKQRGFVIYAGQGELYERVFRLGTVGWITPDEVAAFGQALLQVLEEGPREGTLQE